MHILKSGFAALALCAAIAAPALAEDAVVPSGVFVDQYGTSFEFQPCGEAGTALCAVLTDLKGASATEDNLAFVGKQVIEAKQTAPNEWKGSLAAGGMSADATIKQIDPNTVTIQGCRAAILCQTLAYNKAS